MVNAIGNFNRSQALLGSGGVAPIEIVEEDNFLRDEAYVYYIVNKALDFKTGLVNEDITSLSDYSGNGRTATLTSPVTIGPDNVMFDTPSSQIVQSLDCKNGHSLKTPFNATGFAKQSHEIWIGVTIADGQFSTGWSLAGARSGSPTDQAYAIRASSTGNLIIEYRDNVTGQKLATTNSAYFANGNTGYKVIRIKVDWTAKQIYIYNDSAIDTPVVLDATNNGNLSAFTPANFNLAANWILGNINNNDTGVNDVVTNNRYIFQFAVIPRTLTTQEATDALELFRFNGVYLNQNRFSFTNDQQIESARDAAIDWFFGPGNGLPTGLPTNWITHTTDTYIDLTGFTNLTSCERGEVNFGPISFGTWRTYIYKFTPTVSNGRILLMAFGSADDWDRIANDPLGGREKLALEYFNEKGYTILAWYPCGRGPNLTGDGIPAGQSNTGELIVELENPTPGPSYFNAFSFLHYHVFVAVNYAKNQGFDKISITGISGGGNSTMWATFLDTRIDFSFPVAGWYPNFIKDIYGEDTGETALVLAQVGEGGTFNRLSMLVAGAKSTIIFREYHNVNDGCCFFGNYSKIYKQSCDYILSMIDPGKELGSVIYNVPGEHTYTTAILDDMEALITD